MSLSLFLVYLIGIIAVIVLFILYGKKKSLIYWNMALGIILSMIITLYPLYIYLGDNIADLGEGIGLMFICFMSFINSIVMLIIAIVIRKGIKVINISGKFKSILFTMITFIIYLLVLLIFAVFIPKLSQDKNNTLISDKVITYLENKYGDCGFKINEIEKDYSYNGIVQKYHTGYEVYVTSDLIDKGEEFEIDTNLDGNAHESAFTSFLTEYYYKKYGYKYNSKSRNYVSSDSPLELEVNISGDKIPDDYGKIPTFDEIIEFDALNWFYIYLSEDKVNKYKDDIDTRISYVGKATAALIKKFNINKSMEFDFVGIGLFSYTVKNTGNYLIITGDDDFTDKDDTYSTYQYDIRSGKIIKNENILY